MGKPVDEEKPQTQRTARQAGTQPFLTFEDLVAYRLARASRVEMYAIARGLPSEERFNLKPQIMDAARSLTNNIAEGHGPYHYKESMKFMRDAGGSLQELIDDVNLCLDERYADAQRLQKTKAEGFHLLKVLNGYIAYLAKQAERQA